MILKFYSKLQGCWVRIDNIRQIKTGECRFLPRAKVPDADPSHIETVRHDDKDVELVPVRTSVETVSEKPKEGVEVLHYPELDFDWIVDVPDPELKEGGPPAHKFVVTEHRKDSGWYTESRTLIFAKHTRVFLLNDEGKTLERL